MDPEGASETDERIFISLIRGNVSTANAVVGVLGINASTIPRNTSRRDRQGIGFGDGRAGIGNHRSTNIVNTANQQIPKGPCGSGLRRVFLIHTNMTNGGIWAKLGECILCGVATLASRRPGLSDPHRGRGPRGNAHIARQARREERLNPARVAR